eukprot:2574347-Rhodomonas_salina.3
MIKITIQRETASIVGGEQTSTHLIVHDSPNFAAAVCSSWPCEDAPSENRLSFFRMTSRGEVFGCTRRPLEGVPVKRLRCDPSEALEPFDDSRWSEGLCSSCEFLLSECAAVSLAVSRFRGRPAVSVSVAM